MPGLQRRPQRAGSGCVVSKLEAAAVVGGLIILLATHNAQAQPQQAAGWLSAYDKRPTDATLKYHGLNLRGVDGAVAVADCGRIGQRATLRTVVGDLQVVVFDCGGGADGGHAWMMRNNIVAEVDWYLWQRHPQLVGSWATLHYRPLKDYSKLTGRSGLHYTGRK